MNFKRSLKYIFVGFAGGIIVSTTVMAFSASLSDGISAFLGKDIKILFNNVAFQPRNDDGTPLYTIIYNGRSYLPARYITDKMGGTVGWDDKTRTIKLWSKDFSMTDPKSSGVNEKNASPSPTPIPTPAAPAIPAPKYTPKEQPPLPSPSVIQVAPSSVPQKTEAPPPSSAPMEAPPVSPVVPTAP